MRNVLTALCFFFALGRAAPELFADFANPLLATPTTDNNETLADAGLELELVKRQGTSCATGYAGCSNIGAPGLCCRTNQVCSADAANHIACCPSNAACTGTIMPVASITAIPTSTATNPFVMTTTAPAPTASFVQSGAAAPHVGSTVPNPYFPFVYISTTYTNAAACSSAYTGCQSAASTCYNALVNGVPGVTVTAPNGGAIITAVPSVGSQSASSICASLSLAACSGLKVEACQAFGTGGGSGSGRARNPCGQLYGVGAGVAVGIAGQLLR